MVSIQEVSKHFGAFRAVDAVSFDIRPNEFFALLGPSGCGKTTLLRMIAGLEVPTSGALFIDGVDATDLPANRRPVNMVFQSYAVFPHMSVEQNVAYGLKVEGTPKDEIGDRVARALEMVQLGGFAGRRPDQLSGGQRQRVALARALVKQPKVLLLDEPLSALDAKLREDMQLELASLQERLGITFIIVTHDQDEALSMADRVAVMDKGQIQQIAEPGRLYESPATKFVADFIGRVNLLEGKVQGLVGDGGLNVDVAGLGRVPAPATEGVAAGQSVALAVRPEKLAISRDEPTGSSDHRFQVRGTVADWAYYGDVNHMFVVTDGIDGAAGLRLSVSFQNDTRETMNTIDIGDAVWLSWFSDDAVVLTG